MAIKKKATMQMIADRVGVSITTVSHVFNRSRYVDKDLRQKILHCANEIGYAQKHTSQKGKSKVYSHIGLIVADIREADLFLDIIKISESIAGEHGYSVLIGDAENSPEKEEELVRNFLGKQVHGLLIASTLHSADVLEQIDGFRELPTVLIDRKWSTPAYDFVGIDNFRVSCDSARNMIRKGRRSFCFLGLSVESATMREREEGCRMAVLSEGDGASYDSLRLDLLQDTRQQIIDFCGEPAESESSAPRTLKHDVVFCFNSNVCLALLDSLKHFAVDPRNVDIVTFDGSDWLEYLPFPVTVIKQPATEISITAVTLLMEKIRTGVTSTVQELGKEVRLPVEILESDPWTIS